MGRVTMSLKSRLDRLTKALGGRGLWDGEDPAGLSTFGFFGAAIPSARKEDAPTGLYRLATAVGISALKFRLMQPERWRRLIEAARDSGDDLTCWEQRFADAEAEAARLRQRFGLPAVTTIDELVPALLDLAARNGLRPPELDHLERVLRRVPGSHQAGA
jgi:hypothetical protein